MISNSELNAKEFFRIFGIFFGIIAVLFFILFGMIKATENKWKDEIKISIQSMIDEKNPGEWAVQENVNINSPFKMSSALYKMQNLKTGVHGYAYMVRIQTLYGPFPAVFTYLKGKKPVFIGYSGVEGRIKKLLEENESNARMNYWINKVPQIINDSTGDDE